MLWRSKSTKQKLGNPVLQARIGTGKLESKTRAGEAEVVSVDSEKVSDGAEAREEATVAKAILPEEEEMEEVEVILEEINFNRLL